MKVANTLPFNDPPADDNAKGRIGIALTVSVALNVLALQGAGVLAQIRPAVAAPAGAGVTVDVRPEKPVRVAKATPTVPTTPAPKKVERPAPKIERAETTAAAKTGRAEPAPAPLPEPKIAGTNRVVPKATTLLFVPRTENVTVPTAPAAAPAAPPTAARPLETATAAPANVVDAVRPVASQVRTDAAPELAADAAAPRTPNGIRSADAGRLRAAFSATARESAAASAVDATAVALTAPAPRVAAAEGRPGVVAGVRSTDAAFVGAAGPEADTTVRFVSNGVAMRTTRTLPGIKGGARVAFAPRTSGAVAATVATESVSAANPAARGPVTAAAISFAPAATVGGAAPASFQAGEDATGLASVGAASAPRGPRTAPGVRRLTRGGGASLNGRDGGTPTGMNGGVFADGVTGSAPRDARPAAAPRQDGRVEVTGKPTGGEVQQGKGPQIAEGPAGDRPTPSGPTSAIETGRAELFGGTAGSIVNARVVEFVRPIMPDGLLRTKLNVRVEAKVTLYANGQKRAEIVRGSGHAELDRAVLAALNASRYQTAKRDGQPVDAVLPVTLPITQN